MLHRRRRMGSHSRRPAGNTSRRYVDRSCAWTSLAVCSTPPLTPVSARLVLRRLFSVLVIAAASSLGTANISGTDLERCAVYHHKTENSRKRVQRRVRGMCPMMLAISCRPVPPVQEVIAHCRNLLRSAEDITDGGTVATILHACRASWDGLQSRQARSAD